MLLRSGRATRLSPPRSPTGSRRRSSYSLDATARRSPKRRCSEAVIPPLPVWNRSLALDVTARRSPKRQSFEAVGPHLQVEAVSPPLQVWNRLPTSPRKSDSSCYVDHQVREGVQLPTHLSGSQPELIDEDAYLAKMYPLLPKDQGLNFWKRFVDNAQACLEDYNKKNKANFKYKVSFDDMYAIIYYGNRLYYHLNFLAEDENGPKLFFGEITFYDDELMKERVVVPCCCPVSVNADGGRGFRSFEDIPEGYSVPIRETRDNGHCYACPPVVKHPDGALYRMGHIADPMLYFND